MPRNIHHIARTASDVTLVDEEAALLGKAGKQGRTPLPKLQLLALCTLRLVEPVSFTHIFPYVNEMIARLGVANDPATIGYYSGAVESVFAVMQLCSIYQWAKVSDVAGRRPVLFAGALGLAVSSAMFGLSQSLTALIVARCFSGLFSGTASVVQSVLGDITDATNQSIAFPIFGVIFPLGAIIGPLIGGTFSDPATQHPDWFTSDFWRKFPYFLPGAIAAGISLLAVFFSYFFLKETVKQPAPTSHADALASHKRDSSYGSISSASSSTSDIIIEDPPPSARELLANPLIRALCASGFALSLLGTAFHVLFVLFCFSPVSSGGLGLSAAQIGYALSSAGGLSATAQLLLMPTLLARCNLAKLHARCMAAWPLAYALLPVLSEAPRRGASRAVVFTGVAAALAACQVGWLAYSAAMILVKQSAPPAHLGRTNGLAQFAQCAARAVAPAAVSAMYASTAGSEVLGGHVCAVVMVVVSLGGWMCARDVVRVGYLLRVD